MGGMSLWHWMIVLVVVLLLFGSGRLSAVMGDAAKGIKAFKKGMADDDHVTPPPAHLTQTPGAPAPAAYQPVAPVHAQPPAYAPQPAYAQPTAIQPAPVMQPAPGIEPRQP